MKQLAQLSGEQCTQKQLAAMDDKPIFYNWTQNRNALHTNQFHLNAGINNTEAHQKNI